MKKPSSTISKAKLLLVFILIIMVSFFIFNHLQKNSVSLSVKSESSSYKNSELKDTASFAAGGQGNKPSRSTLPACIKDWQNEPALSDIIIYLSDPRNANVISAWNPCKNLPAILQITKQKLIEAETTRTTLDIKQLPVAPLPDEWYTSNTDIDNSINGGNQSNEILAAKVAGRLLVDYWELVPWRLRDYTNEELATIFKICNPGFNCDSSSLQTGWFSAQNVLDYSPRETWNVLAQRYDVASFTSQDDVMLAMMDHASYFIHGGVYFDSSGNIIRRNDQGIATMEQTASEKVSRHGCQSMSAYTVALAAAYNIPATQAWNYYSSSGHASALFPHTDDVLAHGDDPYNAFYDNTPRLKVYDSYAFWKREVIKKNPGITSWEKSALHEYEMARSYPSNYLMYNYCHYNRTSSGRSFASGRDYLRYAGTGGYGYIYWTEANLDTLETYINSVTQTCTIDPPADDPDNPANLPIS